MKKNERLAALIILEKVLDNKSTLSYMLQTNKTVSAFTKELCFGVCRHYFRLQALADSLLNKRPKSLQIWLTLLLGLYQLHFMQKADYAVVKETVGLLDVLKKPWAKGMINAVLRGFCREQTQILARLQNNEEFIYGHPHWLLQHFKKDWPDYWQSLAQANDAHPPFSLRVNRRRITRQIYLEKLLQAGINAYPHVASPDGITVEKPCDVHELPGFAAGDVSVQDEAAQLAVSLLSLQPGLRVLDACCAPGGKMCHILESEPDLEICVGLDVDGQRLQQVHDNLQRLHLQATLLQGDALTPACWWDGKFFDRILLDAPCSAIGVIRRHPDIKLLRTEAEIDKITMRQKSLLQSLWPLLAPGGLLVYATCSVIKSENELQIARFLTDNTDCYVLDIESAWGEATQYGRQIFPGEKNRDGFFYSLLKKK